MHVLLGTYTIPLILDSLSASFMNKPTEGFGSFVEWFAPIFEQIGGTSSQKRELLEDVNKFILNHVLTALTKSPNEAKTWEFSVLDIVSFLGSQNVQQSSKVIFSTKNIIIKRKIL